MIALLTAVISITLILKYSKTENYSIDEPYAYPSYENDSQWNTLTLEEKKIRCNVPQDVSAAMTTSALVETIFQYPFLLDASGWTEGYLYFEGYRYIRNFENNFSPMSELFSRKNAPQEVEKYRESLSENDWRKKTGKAILWYLTDYVKGDDSWADGCFQGRRPGLTITEPIIYNQENEHELISWEEQATAFCLSNCEIQSLTTKALLETVLACPFLDTPDKQTNPICWLDRISSTYNGINALAERSDAIAALYKFLSVTSTKNYQVKRAANLLNYLEWRTNTK